MTIPNGLPTLARGAHTPHGGEACIMEYVSLLAGETWSDGPECTLAVIAGVARHVNDSIGPARQGLLRLVPRLLTANVEGQAEQLRVSDELMRRIVDKHPSVAVHYNGLHSQWNGVVAYYGTRMGYDFLVEVLDEFDQITGHEPAEVLDEDYARATKAVYQPQDETQRKATRTPSAMLAKAMSVPLWTYTPSS